MAASAARRAIGRASTRIVAALRELEADETLLVQSGKPVGVFRTHADAPRVLIANSNLVPHWATWEHFNELDRKGLMMFGQMTAGSWIYIGSQGIVQGTYETFVEMGRQHYGGNLAGRWILTAGLGGMGGAQPLAAIDGGRVVPGHRMPAQPHRDAPAHRLSRRAGARPRRGAGDHRARHGATRSRSRSALLGNAAEVLPELLRRGVRPDMRHRPDLRARSGERLSAERLDAGRMGERAQQRSRRRRASGQAVDGRARARDAGFPQAGVPTVDYGNNIRQMALEEGVDDAFDFPGFVPAYIRPLFCRGIGPFRWAALSGDPEDIYKTDAKVKELMPDNAHLHHWLDMARARIKFQGLPARICWVGLGDRHRLGLAFNEMVASGELKAPIVIGRDHLDSGSVASPQPRDRGDARRLRRRLRLAAAQRAAQLRVGRHLGVDPSRRRRRHGLLAARRHGHRLRRHARRRASASSACCGTTRRPASCATPMRATRSRSPARARTA